MSFSVADPRERHSAAISHAGQQIQPHERGEQLNTITTAIEKHMRRSNDPHKTFICEEDIKTIWANQDRIGILFSFEEWTATQIELVKENCGKVMSVLIYIGAFACIKSIRDVIFGANFPGAGLELSDKDLPIQSQHKLDFLPAVQFRLFLEKQYCFIPVKIMEEPYQKTIVLPAEFRLPVLAESDEIGMGGYGTVTQVTIPAGYLVQKTGAIWPEVKNLLGAVQWFR